MLKTIMIIVAMAFVADGFINQERSLMAALAKNLRLA